MSARLFTWSPRDADDHERYAELLQAVQRQHVAYIPWTTGGHRSGYRRGDDVYLLRQSGQPRQPHLRGLVAHGRLLRDGVHEAADFRNDDRVSRWAAVAWDEAVEAELALPVAVLKQRLPSVNWEPQRSGTALPDEINAALRATWLEHLALHQARASTATAEALAGSRDLMAEYVLPQVQVLLGFAVTWDYKALGRDDPIVVRVKFPSESDSERNKVMLRRLRSSLLEAQLPRRVAVVAARTGSLE